VVAGIGGNQLPFSNLLSLIPLLSVSGISGD